MSYKDLKALMADLKAVCAAVDEQAALDALETFAKRWDRKYLRRQPTQPAAAPQNFALFCIKKSSLHRFWD
jgi:transposase-like protein